MKNIISKIISLTPKIVGIVLIMGLIFFFAGGGCSDYSVNKKLIGLVPKPPFEHSIEKGKKKVIYCWSSKVTENQIEAYETALKNAGFNLAFWEDDETKRRMFNFGSEYSDNEAPSGNIRGDSITVANYFYRAIYEKDKDIFVIFTGKGLRIDTFGNDKSSKYKDAK